MRELFTKLSRDPTCSRRYIANPSTSFTLSVENARFYSENGQSGIATRFMVGLLLLKHV